jgi:hypothetical protein
VTTLIDGTPIPTNGQTGWGTVLNAALLELDSRFTYSSITSTYALAPTVTASSLTSVGTLTGLNVSGNIVVGGDLTISGTLTVTSTNVTIQDPIITLGGAVPPTSDDNKDRGIKFRWHDGFIAKTGFFGFDDSTGKFTFVPDATVVDEVVSGAKGTLDALVDWADVLNKPDPVITVTLTGDVAGTSSVTLTDLTSGTVTISTAVQANSVALGTDTTGGYVQSLTGGTGVTVTGGTGEGSTPSVAIGQDVATTANAQFASVTTTANVTVGGDLTVNGTTTTLNTTELLIEDNIITLNSGVTGSPSLNAGIEIKRGTSSTVLVRWNEATDVWEFTNDGTNYYSLATKLDDISDVSAASPLDGHILQFDGTNWTSGVLPTNEPMGFEERTDSTISFNNATRQFSISPASASFTVWCNGVRYVKTLTETLTIDATTGLYFIYYNSSGALAFQQDYFNWETEAPVSYVYWNAATSKAEFFADERHGIVLDWQTHEYLHRTRGAAIANGFGVNNFTIVGDGSLDAHAQIDIANGTFFDEDLQVDIVHSATPTANTWEQVLQGGARIPAFYLSGTAWVKDTATAFPLKQGITYPQYNLFSGGTWSTADIGVNRYGVSWIVATNNLNEPIITILGQADYSNIGGAEAVQFSDMILTALPIYELRPLYKIIYQVGAYTNTPNARFRNVVDLRQTMSTAGGVPATPVTDHGSLTGLSDDDHPQYFNESRHDSHDHTTAMASVELNDISNVTAPSPTSGQFLKWNGSAWVNDTIDLGTDTDGNYVASVSGGTGVAVTSGTGEGSTPSIAIGQDVGTTANVQFTSVTSSTLTVDSIELDPTGATTGQALVFNGTKFAPAAVSGGGGGATVTVSDTAPGSPAVGDLWFESDTAKTFVYYDSYWVEIGASSVITNIDGGTPSTIF